MKEKELVSTSWKEEIDRYIDIYRYVCKEKRTEVSIATS